jgi:hypothetical protein
MVPIGIAELQPSDWLMFAFLGVQLFFVLDYGIFTPWWRHPIGWIVLEYGVGVLILMSLIVYGVVYGQRVDEWMRTIAMLMVLLGAIGKEIILKVSRREGRIERRRLAREHELGVSSDRPVAPIERKTVTKKTVPEIWYKGKRALRTAFSTLLTVLPIAPQIIAIVNEQWSSEWLIAVGVQAVAINTVITRVMAIPTVNAWLTSIGLGSVPKSAVIATAGSPIVKRDPKVGA